MRRDHRFQLALGLAVGSSPAFPVFLLARPVDDETVRPTANLAQLLAASAASWAVGQATWVWYEHLARQELPFPSLADVGYLGAIPLAAAAMLAFPGRAERAALQARSLLDGAVIATSLLYTSWALVLGPVFRAGEGGILEQAIALAYPAGDVVLATIVFVVVARIRVGGAPVLLLGTGLLGLAVAISATIQLRGQTTGPFFYWTFVVLVLLIIGRQLLTVLDNQGLNRRLAAMVGELEHQAFHDGLTNLPNRALFRERVGHALRRRSQAGTPLALLFIDLDDFKTVNDQLGHAAGDEFAILLEQAPSHEVAVRVAGRILEAMRPPFPLQGRHVQVGASVGVTISDATEVDAVLREADVAMYLAKARGKGRFELASAGGALDTVGTIPDT